ncbi:thymidine kinase [Gilliamella sp. B2776]|uniref:thymidine kinase n=1 Tax=unclassified Gilliamella TaxID=2685620 RepID=UPI002269D42B|nr:MULTISPECIES: thymidine kinase [unclassified Gilliamella]MCX8650486.1 thymidine kinase [Gilliamella sp. B2779]MCX8654468.1 thymidine kinase [Gilliamella sp. B2737]MCX8656791.1 thymidine kinase [Gilliamella sp. B2894]MCX8665465.1 thymidine kinase [Gilliamella sp. B2887]MCX8692334.1 thymidine kinase [Gilliamella sp. B2776]
MSKIYYIYAVMNAGKSTELLQIDHNYLSNNMQTLLLKSSVDTRDSAVEIVSRLGLRKKALQLDDNSVDEIIELIKKNNYACILIDESQFLSQSTIWKLSDVCDEYGIPMMFFGLKTDYMGHLFEGSKTLLEIADNFRELKTVCWCGKKATMNLLEGKDGQIVKFGNSIHLGDSEFHSVCRKHWKAGQIRPKQ